MGEGILFAHRATLVGETEEHKGSVKNIINAVAGLRLRRLFV